LQIVHIVSGELTSLDSVMAQQQADMGSSLIKAQRADYGSARADERCEYNICSCSSTSHHS